MRKVIDFMKGHPIIAGIIGVSIGVAATKVFAMDTIGKIALLRIIFTLAMSMVAYLISGEKSFENCHTTTGYVVRWGLLTIIPSVLLFIGLIFTFPTGVNTIAAGWPVRVLLAVVASVFVGLFEELTFRVTINDALLYSFRNNKRIFIWIAIISSLVFGAVHVITGSIFTSSMAMGLAVLKTLSVALDGICWLILYWKTRNIWGIALVHALCDFPTFLQSALTEAIVSLGGAENYTGAGIEGLGIYLFQIVCSVVAVIILWIKVGKTIDFEEIRRDW
ncbi:MAG: CPBP family intramembrane metalloprotease [Lachnospiraceae bacterium]|nr:CPBP family intramembrane metalloprotease [Lachnospiraceae bacterium]